MTKSAEQTRRKIVDTFMDFVAKTPPAKRVTVVELTRKMEIDRKTFYHYFDSIDSLVQWIFRNDLHTLLKDEKFSKYSFYKPDESLNDRYPDWNICVKIEPGEKFYAQQLFYKAIGEYFQSYRGYYSKIFDNCSYFELFDYIIALFLPVLKGDIRTMLDGKIMPEPVFNFLAEFYVVGIFGRVSYHYVKTGKFMLQDELDPFFRYAHIMIEKTIESLYVEKGGKWYQDILQKYASQSIYQGEFSHIIEDTLPK